MWVGGMEGAGDAGDHKDGQRCTTCYDSPPAASRSDRLAGKGEKAHSSKHARVDWLGSPVQHLLLLIGQRPTDDNSEDAHGEPY